MPKSSEIYVYLIPKYLLLILYYLPWKKGNTIFLNSSLNFWNKQKNEGNDWLEWKVRYTSQWISFMLL